APLLEPLDLLRVDARAPRSLVDRQLAVEARVGERRLVCRDDCLECARALHLDLLVSAFLRVALPLRGSYRRTSTSPGGVRSSQATSRASRLRAPSSGTRSQ